MTLIGSRPPKCQAWFWLLKKLVALFVRDNSQHIKIVSDSILKKETDQLIALKMQFRGSLTKTQRNAKAHIY